MSNSDEKEWTKTEKGLYVPSTYSTNLVSIVTDRSLEGGVKNEQKKVKALSFKWIINNLTIILLLPSLIGTIWQILELANINLSYIRFFSVTQIPVDGALLLLPITLIYIIYRIMKEIVMDNFNKKIERYETLSNNEKSRVPKQLKKFTYLTLLLTLGVIYCLVYTGIILLPRRPLSFILINGMLISGYVSIMLDTLLILLIKNDLNGGLNSNKIHDTLDRLYSKHRETIAITLLLLIGLIIFLLISSSKLFSDNYVLPQDLYNIQKLEPLVLNDFQTTDYELLYINDKYLFVRLCTSQICKQESKKEIVIYPTEKVLFD